MLARRPVLRSFDKASGVLSPVTEQTPTLAAVIQINEGLSWNVGDDDVDPGLLLGLNAKCNSFSLPFLLPSPAPLAPGHSADGTQLHPSSSLTIPLSLPSTSPS